VKRFVRMGLCLAVGVATVAGCSTVTDYFAGDDNEVAPSELVDFPARIEIETAWAHDAGAGPDDLYLKLRPAVGGGRVFAASRKGRVSSYDAESGDRLWETKAEAARLGRPRHRCRRPRRWQ